MYILDNKYIGYTRGQLKPVSFEAVEPEEEEEKEIKPKKEKKVYVDNTKIDEKNIIVGKRLRH
jgi:ABC-type lipoprotein release transport system permease subunit